MREWVAAGAAEQRGRGSEDRDGEEACEHEQAHARGGDLGQCSEADHRDGEAEVGGEEHAGERLGAMLLGGDFRHRGDRALEHQA